MSELLTEIGRTPERPLRSATVLSVSNGRAKIELATGAVIPDALLIGGISAGQTVRVAYQGGQYIVYGSAADVAPSVSAAGTSSGGASAGGAPTPHDWLGIHHTLPSGAAGLFAATPSASSGTVAMRGIVLSDIQAAADARYGLSSRTITAGAGLTGGGDLTANRTIDVGAGEGIVVDANSIRVGAGNGISVASSPSAVSVRLRFESPIGNTSGLQFDGSGGLCVGAGDGMAVTSASVRINLFSSGGGNASGMQFEAGALKVGAGDGIAVGSNVVAVDATVARSAWKVNAGNGLAVTSSGNLSAAGPTFSVRLDTGSGLSFNAGNSGALRVGAGNGISVGASGVAVDQAYGFVWTAPHTFSARPTCSSGATISAGQTLRIGSGSGDVDLSRKSSDVLALGSGDAMESTSYQSGVSGWTIGSDGAAEFSNVRVRGELAATVFKKKLISATSGTLGVYQSASTLSADRTTPSAIGGSTSPNSWSIKNSDDDDPLFTLNDIVQIKTWTGAAIVEVWMKVTGRTVDTNANNGSRYNFELLAGATSATIRAGTPLVNWGQTGDGVLTLSSDGAIGASPNLSVLTHAGAPQTTTTLRARLGNLNGSYDYDYNAYGFAAGDASTTFVAVDSTDGFRVVRDSIARFTVDTAGALTIRNTAGSAVITLDSTSARIDNVLQIGTNGAIQQGTGSLTATPATYTGLRVDSENSRGRIRFFEEGAVRAALGNLNGSYGFASNTYGFAAGSGGSFMAMESGAFRVSNASVVRFAVDAGGNVSLYDSGGVQRVTLTSAGVFAVGGSSTSVWVDATNGVRITNGSYNRFSVDTSGNVALRDGAGTQRIGLTSAGVVEIDDSAGNARVLIDSGGLKLRDSSGNAAITLDSSGNSQFTGVMTIGTSGEIRQGAGSLTASPATYTGLRLWRDGSIGRIAGYNGGTLQWYAGTDGKLYAGGGGVKIDSSGIFVDASTVYDTSPNGIQWSKPNVSDSRQIHVYTSAASGSGIPSGSQNATLYLENLNSVAGGAINITAQSGSGQTTYGASVSIRAERSTSFSQVQVRHDAVFFTGGGINVGSATGAATGDVKFSGSIIGTGTEGLRTTWTPTFEWSGGGTGTFTYDVQSAVYTKVANVVYIAARITLSAVAIGTSTGNLRIGGLPFTVAQITPLPVASVAGCANWTTNTPDRGIFFNNTTYIQLYSGPLTTQTIGTANVSGTSSIYISGFYYT